MNAYLMRELFGQVRKVSKRSWLIVPGIVACAAALLVWAVVALFTAAWSQLPQAAEIGKRAIESAAQGVEQVAPDLEQRVNDLLAHIGERAVTEPPAADVSGTDIGPVARYPGLVRTEFSRDTTSVSVRYVGGAPLAMMLAHYARDFADAGYAHEVLSATADHEQHRFSSEQGTTAYELSLERLERGLLAVTLIQKST